MDNWSPSGRSPYLSRGSPTTKSRKKFTTTGASNPIKAIKYILKVHNDFYIFPGKDKRESPPHYHSSKHYSKALKQAFGELKKEDGEKTFTGWFTMELWERHTKARNHLLFTAGPLIDLKWAVDKVVVHHGTRPRETTRACALLPQHPYVSIHFNTSKQPSDPIDCRDLDAQGMSIQMALGAINIPNSISMVEINPRFDVHRDILFKYYNERRLIKLGNGKNPSPVTEKTLTDVRAFQKLLNRTFQPGQDDISLNFKDAVYQLDGGIIVRPAHEQFMRFEWKLPSQRGERPCFVLGNLIPAHPWASLLGQIR